MEKEQKLLIARIIFAAALCTATVWISEPWLVFALCLLGYAAVAYDVWAECFEELKEGEILNEAFLMILATVGAFVIGEAREAVAVMALFQLGEFLEDLAVDRSKDRIRTLLDLRPQTVRVKDGDVEILVSPETIDVGTFVYVYSGERIPMDGCVVEGQCLVDQKALTGESTPMAVAPNSSVYAGSIALDGSLVIRVTKRYDETSMSQMIEMTKEAEEKKAAAENFIERFCKYYTPIVMGLALCVFLIPLLFVGFSHWSEWLRKALTFLVISCPCALVISIPLTFFAGIGALSSAGVFVKGGTFVEKLAKLKVLAFDKTGTLTVGAPAVDADTDPKLLEMAAHAEAQVNHPIASALRAAYSGTVDASRVTDVQVLAGKGVRCRLDGKAIAVGNDLLMADYGYNVSNDRHRTMVHLCDGERYLGWIALSDREKPEAAAVIATLHRMSVKTVVLSGDHKTAAETTGQRVGIEQVHAGLLPQEKVAIIEQLQKQSAGCCGFVGDGINDAPVLAAADVGIAMGTLGQDAAIEACDVVLMNDRLELIPLAMRSSRRTMRIARQNVIFILTVKLAVLILATLGIASLWMGIVADVGVCLLAIFNALRAMKTMKPLD